jgi:AcrR family transcriptional regulator
MTSDQSRSGPRRTRRDEYAEQTRMAVVDAARELFAEQGFFATTVAEIAEASRVSAGTVYQQCGGKQGLLRTLMDMWTTAPMVAKTIEQIYAANTVEEVLDLLADAYLTMFREFGDIIQVFVATAPHDDEASTYLEQATSRHRAALLEIAQRLRALGAFPDSFSNDDFADIALFHFGAHNGIQYAVTELGWDAQRARDWIHRQFTRSLLETAAASDG